MGRFQGLTEATRVGKVVQNWIPKSKCLSYVVLIPLEAKCHTVPHLKDLSRGAYIQEGMGMAAPLTAPHCLEKYLPALLHE